jgi:tetratricopeptide (TPR) repeat protein
MRKLNLPFLAGLLVTVGVLSGAVYFVRKYEVNTNSRVLRDQALEAKKKGDLERASGLYGNYLNLITGDAQTWKEYAEVLDERDAEAPAARRVRVLATYQQALRLNPGDPKLERRCADLAMKLGDPDAKSHITNLLSKFDRDEKPPIPEKAELEEMLGDCHARESNFDQAVKQYKSAIQDDPKRVASYDRIARIYRNEHLASPAEADKLIEQMIASNNESGSAYRLRFLYDEQFPVPGKEEKDLQKARMENDLEKALSLSPDDPDVLLTAATFSDSKRNRNDTPSEAKRKLDEIRKYLEKGLRLHPDRLEFAARLASLEQAEQHPEQAVAILRKAYEHKPTTPLTYVLARLLIALGKIDGENEANTYMAVLRRRGTEGDIYLGLLEPMLSMRQEDWNEAIRQIESAQTLLKSLPPYWNAQFGPELSLMLADCYRRTNSSEQRVAALQSAADLGGNTAETADILLAQELARSDSPADLERAARILRSLADRYPDLHLELCRVVFRTTLFQPKGQRDWTSLENQLKRAEKALNREKRPEIDEALTMLQFEMKVAREKPDEARALLTAALAKNPRNVSYILGLSRLALRQGDKEGESLRILDKAEKEFGLGRQLLAARVAYWGEKGGPSAKGEVAKIAEVRKQVPAANRPALLLQLAEAELRLGELKPARQYWSELAELQPKDLQVLLALFDLSLAARDKTDAESLIERIKKVENPRTDSSGNELESITDESASGTNWRYAKARYLINQEISRRSPGGSAATTLPGSNRTKSTELEAARKLADEIFVQRPQWWGVPLLQSDISALEGQEDDAINKLLSAVEMGCTRPDVVQRLIGALHQTKRFADIDRIVDRFRDQADSSTAMKFATAISAMRKGEYKRGISLASELLADSKRYSDHIMLGRFYAVDDQQDQAEAEFRRAVDLGPGVPDTWINYVRYLVRRKKLDAAKAAVASAQSALPQDRSTLPLAQCYFLLREPAKAEELITKALHEKPDEPVTLRYAASFYLSQGQTKKGVEFLDRLRAPAPGATQADLAWANQAQAAALIKTGRRADLATAERLIGRNPTSDEDKTLRATILAMQPGEESHREAIRLFEEMDQAKRLEVNEQFRLAQLYLNVERDESKYQNEMVKVLVDGKSTSPQHLAEFIAFLINRRQLDQAQRWLADLKRAEPQGVPALEMEALLLKARHDERSSAPAAGPGTAPAPGAPATEVRDLLVAASRKSPEVIGPVAVLLGRHGFPAEAEAAYNEFVARDPKQPERVLALAAFLAGQKGRTADALALLTRAWQTCPPEQVAAAALSVYDAPSVTESQRKQVEAWLAEASQKRPDLVGLANKLGAIWIRQGKFDEAEGKYRQLLLNSPDNSEAMNNLAWLLALRDSSQTGDAEKLIDDAIGLQGPTASLLDTRAVVQLRAGRIAEAIQTLKDAAARDPRNPSVPLHLAWAYQSAQAANDRDGSREEARKNFQKAVEMGWSPERSDPLERPHMDRLRRDLGL